MDDITREAREFYRQLVWDLFMPNGQGRDGLSHEESWSQARAATIEKYGIDPHPPRD